MFYELKNLTLTQCVTRLLFCLILDDGQTCDLAYEMFECVSEKIEEVRSKKQKFNYIDTYTFLLLLF